MAAGDAVERAINTPAGQSGPQPLRLNPAVFSAHSTRVGAVQGDGRRKIESIKIVDAARWSSDRRVAAYTRRLAAHRGAAADLARMLEKHSIRTTPLTADIGRTASLDSVLPWLPSNLENSEQESTDSDTI